MSHSEQELLRRYAEQGDAEAFRALVESHRDMVFSVCKRILRNAADAEDAAQSCFLQLARKAATLKSPIAGWLHHVAAQVALNIRKQNDARLGREIVAAGRRHSSSEASWDEIQSVVDEAVSALPDRLRVPLVLHYLEGHTQERIAEELGISQPAVSARMKAGLEALRKRLKKAGILASIAALGSLLAANSVEASPTSITAIAGKMALVGAAGGKAAVAGATIGGISMLKLGIASVAVAGVLLIGGFAVHNVLSANPGPTQPTVAVQPAPIAPAVSAKEKIARVITGNVTLPDGKPAAGALVRLFYFHDASGFGSRWLSETRADEHGDFSIGQPVFKRPLLLPDGPVLKCYLVATSPGYGAEIVPVFADTGEGYSIILWPACALKCTVLNKQDKPAKDQEVACLFLSPNLPFWDDRAWPAAFALWRGVTDANGVVLFDDVPKSYLLIRAIGQESYSYASEHLESTNDLNPKVPFSITLKPELDVWKIRGRVTFGDTGKPAAGMLVTTWIRQVITDADGRFEAAIRLERARLPELRERKTRLVHVYDPSDKPQYAPAWLSAEDADPEKVAAIVMQRGRVLSGKVTDMNSGKPIPYVPLSHWTTLFRTPSGVSGETMWIITGEDGHYESRLADDKGGFGVETPIPGYLLMSDSWRGRSEGAPDFELDVRPEISVDVWVKNPDGSAASAASVLWAQPERPDLRMDIMETNTLGRVRAGGIAERQDLLTYVISKDKRLAASAIFPMAKREASKPFEVALKPARTGKIVLRGDNGQNLPSGGEIMVHVQCFGKPRVSIFAEYWWDDVQRQRSFKVPGLLSGQESSVRLANPAHGAHSWEIAEDDDEPVLTLEIHNDGRPATRLPAPRDLKKQIAALKDVVWERADIVQAHLTWFALKSGLALANTKSSELKLITELLGERDFVPSSIAFGKGKVWVGTNKGLFAWDRKDMFWTRFAVGGTVLDADIKNLSLADDGRLAVTIEQKPDASRKFECDTMTSKWTDFR